LYTLNDEEVMSDLQAVYAYADGLDASNGIATSVGFCRGGSQSFRFATTNPELDASFVFYGTAPEEETVYENMQVPVIAFY
jgi:carboxymethylenebutenolidase